MTQMTMLRRNATSAVSLRLWCAWEGMAPEA